MPARRGTGRGELDGRGAGLPGDCRLPAATAPDAASPWAWAAEDSVKALLGPLGYAVRLARRMASFSYRSPDSYIGYLEEVHGPTIMALRLAGGHR